MPPPTTAETHVIGWRDWRPSALSALGSAAAGSYDIEYTLLYSKPSPCWAELPSLWSHFDNIGPRTTNLAEVWYNGLNSNVKSRRVAPLDAEANWTTLLKRGMFLLSIPTWHYYIRTISIHSHFRTHLDRLSCLVLDARVVYITNASRYFVLVVTSLTHHCLWLAR